MQRDTRPLSELPELEAKASRPSRLQTARAAAGGRGSRDPLVDEEVRPTGALLDHAALEADVERQTSCGVTPI